MKTIPIVFENDDFVIVNKPDGVAVQNEQLQSGILPYIQKQLQLDKLWLVHRLDKVTSGLLLLAKNASAASRLSQYFAERKIQKYYLAISDKKPKKKQGAVIGDMHKIRDGKWALKTSLHQPAAGQFFSAGLGNGLRLFVIKPHTGKTHQIRVMLKSLSSPILGDNTYAGTESERTYLHAYGLAFEDCGQQIQISCMPVSGQHFTIPTDNQKAVALLSPWDLVWPKLTIKKSNK
ncbi:MULTISPECIES: TIGR01621 family pseudouridine synthase [Alteromonadaceae]|uniref:TIGR01621 family pseudouridine synthase n=1 Tax=Alteromonadaceae TaxID=72275 RepID=UPI001C08AACB|nr:MULTISPECIES: TIGR01621 family pseudouridine synthase [Aliiglaciecola]MBU2879943.1 TIGR01621 family pseudouridine synthase [Aliiglaciecola lipolytica]MDO6712371.1 TIGR01621 family pseudouridine synthase [Aliiglaciecola sp. 2_MG-2023]MDO6753365.1 TIGR01621 family pseudouridine synthase [Aliiglaciecola sp. 1_MG-2023]